MTAQSTQLSLPSVLILTGPKVGPKKKCTQAPSGQALASQAQQPATRPPVHLRTRRAQQLQERQIPEEITRVYGPVVAPIDDREFLSQVLPMSFRAYCALRLEKSLNLRPINQAESDALFEEFFQHIGRGCLKNEPLRKIYNFLDCYYNELLKLDVIPEKGSEVLYLQNLTHAYNHWVEAGKLAEPLWSEGQIYLLKRFILILGCLQKAKERGIQPPAYWGMMGIKGAAPVIQPTEGRPSGEEPPHKRARIDS